MPRSLCPDTRMHSVPVSVAVVIGDGIGISLSLSVSAYVHLNGTHTSVYYYKTGRIALAKHTVRVHCTEFHRNLQFSYKMCLVPTKNICIKSYNKIIIGRYMNRMRRHMHAHSALGLAIWQ